MGDLNELINQLSFHHIKDIISEEWWNLIEKQNILSQQAITELGGEESVLIAFTSNPKKIQTLVNEILCISIWKKEILPKLLQDADEETMANFCLIYIILYHETVVVSLLEILLYHTEACTALEDSAIDLVDYCAAEITHLLVTSDSDKKEDVKIQDELLVQSSEIDFGIGMRCITIVMYLAENLDRLSLSVTTRLFSTYDFPLLLTHLLDKAPWIKTKNDLRLQFTDGYWQEKSEGSLVGRHEANAWLAIHQLLLHPELGKYYQVTDYAKGQFMRLESKIRDGLLSQLPPLQQLKQGLLYMSNFEMPAQRPPIIMELIPEMKNAILSEGAHGWEKIVKLHKKRLVQCKNISDLAEKFSKTLQPMENPANLCTNCSRPAKSRCSRCKKSWYCSRDCQLQHFSYHKSKCIPA